MTALEQILHELEPYDAKLIAVSKTKPIEAIQQIYDQGQRSFGENRAQELAAKYKGLPKDIEWHMIGHLQSNKVKYIASFVAMVHAIDSIALLQEVNKRAGMHDRCISVLLQVKIAHEESKYGFDPVELEEVVGLIDSLDLPHVQIAGLMGMASFVDNVDQVASEFKLLGDTFDRLKSHQFKDDTGFKELSMGMSGDYLLALAAGSTMVRIGSLIFGVRH